eukprot:UC1_evm1s2089
MNSIFVLACAALALHFTGNCQGQTLVPTSRSQLTKKLNKVYRGDGKDSLDDGPLDGDLSTQCAFQEATNTGFYLGDPDFSGKGYKVVQCKDGGGCKCQQFKKCKGGTGCQEVFDCTDDDKQNRCFKVRNCRLRPLQSKLAIYTDDDLPLVNTNAYTNFENSLYNTLQVCQKKCKYSRDTIKRGPREVEIRIRTKVST